MGDVRFTILSSGRMAEYGRMAEWPNKTAVFRKSVRAKCGVKSVWLDLPPARSELWSGGFGACWPEFTNESPGDFRHLSVVVMNEETVAKLLVQFDADRFGTRRNVVRFADGFVRLEKRKAIVKLNGKGVFP